MNTKEIEELKKPLKLTKRQRDIIVGLLLGDGHLETQNNGRTYRLKVEHSTKQKDYVEWLYGELKNWVHGGIYRKQIKGNRCSTGFTTYSHGMFRFYGQQFYCNRKKKVPALVKKLLCPIGLAVWFMDDGSRKSLQHRTYILHTLGYSREDLERLSEALEKKFNLKSNLHRQKNEQWRLYILSNSAKEFEKIINPYISRFSSMKHKLSNKLPKE